MYLLAMTLYGVALGLAGWWLRRRALHKRDLAREMAARQAA